MWPSKLHDLAAIGPHEAALRGAARMLPSAFWRRYRALCARLVAGPRFLLSFDCDTVRDFRVVRYVNEHVVASGAKPTYAVPGELLARGIAEYSALLDAGATFMNHGYAEHSWFDDTSATYRSTLDYRDLSHDRVADDVVRGHHALMETLGVSARGFRTPHFGSYQRPEDLAHLHEVLGRLSYRWSSSTTPVMSFRRGPAYRDGSIWELPVSGCPTHPLSVLDSYSFRYTSGGRGMDAFEREAALLAGELERGAPFVVSVYADPSQVYDWPGFFEVVGRLSPFATSFDDFVAEVSAHL